MADDRFEEEAISPDGSWRLRRYRDWFEFNDGYDESWELTRTGSDAVVQSFGARITWSAAHGWESGTRSVVFSADGEELIVKNYDGSEERIALRSLRRD